MIMKNCINLFKILAELDKLMNDKELKEYFRC